MGLPPQCVPTGFVRISHQYVPDAGFPIPHDHLFHLEIVADRLEPSGAREGLFHARLARRHLLSSDVMTAGLLELP